MKQDPKKEKERVEIRLPGVEHGTDEPLKAEIPSDVLGSYTGVPLDREMPEQDQDDL